jgi:hypothetical protein
MKWARLILIVALAAFSFAGSFECHVHSGDDTTTKKASKHLAPS